MTGITHILNLGSQSLFAQQKAIETTGHNIANASTPGFSRQRVILAARQSLDSGLLETGTGVHVESIQRIRDQFLEAQFNTETQESGRWDAQKGALERVEAVLHDPSGYGLDAAMQEFWNAWQDLANNPSGQGERAALASRSETLSAAFNRMSADLEQIRTELGQRLERTVEQINLLSEQIGVLNGQISQALINGQNAGDLMDKRGLLLNELSSMVNVTSFEEADGQIAVMTGGGRPLVQDGLSWQLSAEVDGGGTAEILWLDNYGGSADLTTAISSGELKGWLEVRDAHIPDYSNRLDTLAQGVIEDVNDLHMGGFGLDGSTNEAFFSGSSASDMEVSAWILGDVRRIAAAEEAAGLPGDNRMALAIADLRNAATLENDTLDYGSYHEGLISDVGSRTLQATRNSEHQAAVVQQIGNYLESSAGVSLDEEMVNLLKYQHAYEAAAKLISTVDELLQELLNIV